MAAFPPGSPESDVAVSHALEQYAESITGWAEATAKSLLHQVGKADRAAWDDRVQEMAGWLRRELATTETGPLMRELMAEQVTLIKSIPLDAAQRVHEWTAKGQEDGTRAAEVAKEIRRTQQVSEARAMLIARTETARTASKLTEARARGIGSEGYIWRTADDEDVRHSHDEMEGKYVRWDKPPTLSDGTTTHAGQIYYCRCYPEPVLPS